MGWFGGGGEEGVEEGVGCEESGCVGGELEAGTEGGEGAGGFEDGYGVAGAGKAWGC